MKPGTKATLCTIGVFWPMVVSALLILLGSPWWAPLCLAPLLIVDLAFYQWLRRRNGAAELYRRFGPWLFVAGSGFWMTWALRRRRGATDE